MKILSENYFQLVLDPKSEWLKYDTAAAAGLGEVVREDFSKF